MRTRHFGFRRTDCLVVSFLLLLLTFVSQTPEIEAQKLPIALKKSVNLSPTNETDYKTAAANYSSSRTIANRNKLIYLAVAQTDLNFADFQKSKRKRNQLFQTLLDILEIGASTAISVTNGERAKTLIAEGLGFVQSSRASINKNLRLLELQILFNKMIAKRAEIYRGIALKSALPDEVYPFEMAFVDIVSYYRAGTIDGALNDLATDTGAEANKATRDLPTLTIATKADVEKAVTFDNYVADLVRKAKSGDVAAISKIKTGLKKFVESGLESYEVLPADKSEIDALDTNAVIDLLGELRAQLALNNKSNIDKLFEFLQ